MAYFSNGSEGEYLESQCEECLHANPESCCPIAAVQVLYNYDQLEEGQEKLRAAMNLLIDKHGNCQMRKQIVANLDALNAHRNTVLQLVVRIPPSPELLICDFCFASETADCHKGPGLRPMYRLDDDCIICQVCLDAGKHNEVMG